VQEVVPLLRGGNAGARVGRGAPRPPPRVLWGALRGCIQERHEAWRCGAPARGVRRRSLQGGRHCRQTGEPHVAACGSRDLTDDAGLGPSLHTRQVCLPARVGPRVGASATSFGRRRSEPSAPSVSVSYFLKPYAEFGRHERRARAIGAARRVPRREQAVIWNPRRCWAAWRRCFDACRWASPRRAGVPVCRARLGP